MHRGPCLRRHRGTTPMPPNPEPRRCTQFVAPRLKHCPFLPCRPPKRKNKTSPASLILPTGLRSEQGATSTGRLDLASPAQPAAMWRTEHFAAARLLARNSAHLRTLCSVRPRRSHSHCPCPASRQGLVRKHRSGGPTVPTTSSSTSLPTHNVDRGRRPPAARMAPPAEAPAGRRSGAGVARTRCRVWRGQRAAG